MDTFRNHRQGVFLMLGSVLAFSLMATLVKMVREVHPYVIVFIRFSIGLGVLGILAMWKAIRLKFVRSPLLMLRGISGSISVALFYFSIVHIGMGKSSVYSYSYPVFAALMSSFFLGEMVNRKQWIFIAFAFIGIVLLAFDQFKVGVTFNWYEILAILSAITNAVSIVLVRKLHETDDSYAIFFAQSIVGFWIFLLPAQLPALTGEQLNASWLLILVGLSGVLAQLLNTEGFRYLSVSKGAPLHMLIPVCNVSIGVAFFNETFSLVEAIGAVVVVVSCLLLMVQGRTALVK